MTWLDISRMSDRVVTRSLADRARHLADSPYLLTEGREPYSFAEVDECSNRIGFSLRELGVKAGDTVSLFMANSAEMALAAFAINKLGAVWVPTNTAYRGEWLRDTLLDSRASLAIVDAELMDRFSEVQASSLIRTVIVKGKEKDSPGTIAFKDLLNGQNKVDIVDASAHDLVSVMWTSGTTGRSKGVMQTHSTWLSGADLMSRNRDIQADDVIYNCVPMYNSGGWVTGIYAALVAGIPVAIDAEFSVSNFWNRCRLFGATQTFTLGAMHMYLWQAPPRPDDGDNPVRVAGLTPMPVELIEPFKERFGIEYVWQGTGQSEVMPIAMTSRGVAYKPGSCAYPREDLDVALLNDDDEPVAVGEVGEICVRPRRPGVIFAGYYGQPEATLTAFRNLWYHTGDLGKSDSDGELYFVDRKADFMRYKGRNVSSLELEAVVLKHPDVAEVAAHGVPSAELETEDEVKICVVLKPGATANPAELARFVNDNAPYFYVPRYIEFLEELPHTPTGRVQKYILKQRGDRGLTAQTWDRERSGFEVQR